MTGKYILDKNGNPQPCEDIYEWGEWYEKSTKQRKVARDKVGKVTVSTVFIGIDHNFGEGPPLLFETMIFNDGGEHDQYQERYSTRQEALAGHIKALRLLEAKPMTEEEIKKPIDTDS